MSAVPEAQYVRGPAPARLGRRPLVIAVAFVWGMVIALALIVVLLAATGPPRGECPPGRPCGNPPRSPLLVTGTTWRSSALGYRLEYPADTWDLREQSGTGLLLSLNDRAFLRVEGARASQRSPQHLYDARLQEVKGRLLGLTADTEPAHEILGPQVAYRHGVGGTFVGTADNPQGVSSPVGVAIMAAGDRQLSLVVTVMTTNSDEEQRDALMARADAVLNTIRLPSDAAE